MTTTVTKINVTKRAQKNVVNHVNGQELFDVFSATATVGNKVVIGTSNPSWKIQIAKRTDASTAYSKTVFRVKHMKDTYVRTRRRPAFNGDSNSSSWVRCFDYGIGLSVGSLTDETTRGIALDRLKRQLRDASHEAQLLAPIAELGQLGRTIRSAAEFTGRALEAAIEIKRRRRGRRAVRLLQDTWLNWNFGILPLLRDISNAGEAISNYMMRQDITLKLYGVAHKNQLDYNAPSFTFADGVAPDGYTVKGFNVYKKRISYKFVGAYNLKLRSANDYTLLDNLGINLRSIPSTLWELTALSWIADYFGTIGNYLSDVFYAPPGNLIYLNELRIVEAHQGGGFEYVRRSGFSPSYYITEESIPGSFNFHFFDFQRTPLGSLPVSPIRIRSSDEIAPHSVSKVLNLLSLIGRGQ